MLCCHVKQELSNHAIGSNLIGHICANRTVSVNDDMLVRYRNELPKKVNLFEFGQWKMVPKAVTK